MARPRKIDPANPQPPQTIPVDQGGQPPVTIDIKRVEELAAGGLPWTRIAQGLGISQGSMVQMRHGKHPTVDRDELLDAYQRGAFAYSQSVQSRLDKHGDKNFIPLMFLAKQAHVLGYSDRQEVSHSGTVKIVREESVIHDRDSVIDAEYTDLGGDD